MVLFWGGGGGGGGAGICYFKFTHSSNQTKPKTRQDIYLKDVILALSWGPLK